MTDQSNTMTAVSLNDGETAGDTPLTPSLSLPPVTNVEETDTNNSSDEDIDSLLQELHTSTSSEASNTRAIENLRRSTVEFTSTIGAVTKNIDSKLHFSSNAHQIDSKLGVSSTVSRTSEQVSSIWDRIQSSAATQTIQKSVSETVSKGTKVVGDTVDRSGLGGVLSKEKERMKEFDSQHGITQGTLGALASGMNFMSKSVKGLTKVRSGDDEDQSVDNENDYDNLLSTSADDESDLKIGDDQVKGDGKVP